MEERVGKLLSSSSNYLAYIKCDTTPDTPPLKCAVPSCSNKFVSFEEHQRATYKFHNFPENPEIRLKWKGFCQLPDKASVKKLKVCSDHFTLEDYIRNLKLEFLNPDHKRCLKTDALPSIKPGPCTSHIQSYEIEESEAESEGEAGNENEADNPKNLDSDETESPAVLEKKNLLVEISTLRSSIKRLGSKIRDKKLCISRQANTLRALKRNPRFNRVHVNNTLQSIFSKAQIKLLKGSKKVYWSDDDLAQAFTLRHMGGKEFYLYMKNTLNYPLPSLSCVQAWSANS